MSVQKDLYPTFDQILTRKDREELLSQKSKVIWFTGLSGAGKTTLAKHLQKRLHEQGKLTYILDGDNVRLGINKNLGFSIEDRTENIRRISEVAKLMIDAGVIVLCTFISPTVNIRHMAEEIIGHENFFKVFVNTPLAVCEQRDVKGLYAKARRGEIKNFTGIDSPFEDAVDSDIEIRTDLYNVDECVDQIINKL